MHPVLSGVLIALPLLVAAVGGHNPLDALARGRWLRNTAAGTGQATQTLCVPAETLADLPAYQAQLPGVFAALRDAGATAVGVDLPLPSDPALRAAILDAAAPLAVAWASEPPPTLSTPAHRLASAAMQRTPLVDLNLGAAVPATEGPWPLALELVALHHGATPARDGDALVAGPHRWEGGVEVLPFMPYWIDFIEWDQPETWAAASGRMVILGACRATHELARYGRQPATVAHSELVETIVAGQRPRQAPLWLDLLAALGTGLAAAGLRRAAPRLGLLGPTLLGLAAAGVALLAAASGLWAGLSGLALAGACYGLAAGAPRARAAR